MTRRNRIESTQTTLAFKSELVLYCPGGYPSLGPQGAKYFLWENSDVCPNLVQQQSFQMSIIR